MATIILLNKPFNVLSQFTDQRGRSTLADFITCSDVYPAGRLDYDSEGLMVLTDSGQLQQQISRPGKKHGKTYWVQVEGVPQTPQLERLRQGITLKDGPCLPARVKLIEPPSLWPRDPPIRQRQNKPTSWLELTLYEGRNRQIRRMTAEIGCPTLRLVRIKIGPWSVDPLLPGESKALTVHASVRPKHQRRTHKSPGRL